MKPPGFKSSFQVSIQASRLEVRPPGCNSSLQASIQASRVQFKLPGFNLNFEISAEVFIVQFEHPDVKKIHHESDVGSACINWDQGVGIETKAVVILTRTWC